MLEISEAYVDALAPNSGAIKNGRDLVKKKKLVLLQQSADGDLLFGECAGSGKSNYACSVDFAVPEKPVARCNCPSRQFPCKHALALLYAFVDGQEFSTAEVPEDLVEKRSKAEKRQATQQAKAVAEEVSDAAPAKPKKVNKAALRKKLTAQLEGLDVLEKLVLSLVRGGLGTVDSKRLRELDAQIKQLGNHYVPGAQIELRALQQVLQDLNQSVGAIGEAAEQLTRIHALLKRGRKYLNDKLEDSELKMDTESAIEEWLGHAWQMNDLQSYGLFKEKAELLQLAFLSYDDKARQEWVDMGYWIDLLDGDIHQTLNYRPYRAAKHLKEEDSFSEIVQASPLYIYPGTLNRRVRYEGMSSRAVTPEDTSKAASYAERSIAAAIKQVRGELKNPLGKGKVAVLLHAASIQEVTYLVDEEKEQTAIVVIDESGEQLRLSDLRDFGASATRLLRLVRSDLLEHAALLVVFAHDRQTGELLAEPAALIKNENHIRLWY